MAWFLRFTRFGDAHWVFGQESQISCGVACVIMAAFKINKLTPNTKALFSEADILKKAEALFGPNPLGADGLNNPKMLQLLNQPGLKMTGWRFHRLPRASVPGKLMDVLGVNNRFGPTMSTKPVIVGVDWNNGGGHWVLVDSMRTFAENTYATVCDPWDANVHVTSVTKDQSFQYAGKPETARDLWGTRYEYQKPSLGSVFLGDVLWRP